jgi:hypothetical protein
MPTTRGREPGSGATNYGMCAGCLAHQLRQLDAAPRPARVSRLASTRSRGDTPASIRSEQPIA